MRMAYFAKKDSQGCIDFDNLVVDYTDGEIAADDRVKDISRLFPLKPKTNLIALCVRGKVQLRSGGNRFDVPGHRRFHRLGGRLYHRLCHIDMHPSGEIANGCRYRHWCASEYAALDCRS